MKILTEQKRMEFLFRTITSCETPDHFDVTRKWLPKVCKGATLEGCYTLWAICYEFFTIDDVFSLPAPAPRTNQAKDALPRIDPKQPTILH